jgi:DNA-binding NtrC family response regulator
LASASAAGRSGSKTHLILVVDDDPDIRSSLATLIEAFFPSAEVRTMPSGLDGLAVVDREPVDLVLTDLRMRGLDGFHFIQRVHELRPHLPCVLITADRDPELPTEAIIYGAKAFLPKPFNNADVKRVISSLVPRAVV